VLTSPDGVRSRSRRPNACQFPKGPARDFRLNECFYRSAREDGGKKVKSPPPLFLSASLGLSRPTHDMCRP